ncbi:hypothetical protein [Scandinavium goeteborgense]|uniref:Uncharacterized protein n=1 Tax=Scandinavium goeteborgense TaxID=1851514 RepID=A0A4R6DSN5_SCAGO|nr:hypothetical protein [Scandinavium goeteborgense]TDN48087.1 hypothetical protein EC847_12838 [Scandinavium goeteborgense]
MKRTIMAALLIVSTPFASASTIKLITHAPVNPAQADGHYIPLHPPAKNHFCQYAGQFYHSGTSVDAKSKSQVESLKKEAHVSDKDFYIIVSNKLCKSGEVLSASGIVNLGELKSTLPAGTELNVTFIKE